MGIVSLAFSALMVASKDAYDSFRAGPMPFVAEPLTVERTRPICETQRQRLLAATATAFERLTDVDVFVFTTANLNEEDVTGRSLRLLENGAMELRCKGSRGKTLVFERLDDIHFFARSAMGSGFVVLKCVD